MVNAPTTNFCDKRSELGGLRVKAVFNLRFESAENNLQEVDEATAFSAQQVRNFDIIEIPRISKSTWVRMTINASWYSGKLHLLVTELAEEMHRGTSHSLAPYEVLIMLQLVRRDYDKARARLQRTHRFTPFLT